MMLELKDILNLKYKNYKSIIISMTEDYFSHLSKEERRIIVGKGTENPFSGEYDNFFEAGVFICRACKAPLYESNTKFDSGCGWPSFDDEIEGRISRFEDFSGGRIRTEICCKKCEGHLGHVFHGENITYKNTRHCVNSLSIQFKKYDNLSKAYFGAGCFWSVEQIFREITGVYMCQSGYMGGHTHNPNYTDVCTGKTNHAEVVEIYYDDKDVSYNELLKIFWKNHNPTNLNRQGNDIGTQYRSVIFFTTDEQKVMAKDSVILFQKDWENKITTQIESAKVFYRAEEYHQNYLNKNNLGSCHI